MKTCEQCGTEFEPDKLHPFQKYCSRNCSNVWWNISRRKRKKKILCKICKKEFEPKAFNGIYCSEECRKEGARIHDKLKYRKHNPKKILSIRTCPVCKKEFRPISHSNAIYCSKRCYRKTDEYKKYMRKYMNMKKNDIKYQNKRKAYRESEHGKKVQYIYNHSEKAIKARAIYAKKIESLRISQMPFKGKPFQLFLIDIENFGNDTNPLNVMVAEFGRQRKDYYAGKIKTKPDFRPLLQKYIDPFLPKDEEYIVMWFGNDTLLNQFTSIDQTHHKLYILDKEKSIDPRITGKAYEYLAKYPKQISKVWLWSGDIDLVSIVEACIAQNKPCELVSAHSDTINGKYYKIPKFNPKNIHLLF